MYKKYINYILIIFLLATVAQAHVCQDEEVPLVGCTLMTPGNMTCSNYWIYAENGTLLTGLEVMTELYSGTGIYNVTFNQSVSQGYTIHLCDKSTAYIKVGNTIYQEVDSVEENQAVLQTQVVNLNISIPKAVWDYNATLAVDNSTGDLLEDVWKRLKDSSLGTLLADLIAELSGGYFG